MAKIKKCIECGKKFKMSRKYAEYVSDKICIKCENKQVLEDEYNSELGYEYYLSVNGMA